MKGSSTPNSKQLFRVSSKPEARGGRRGAAGQLLSLPRKNSWFLRVLGKTHDLHHLAEAAIFWKFKPTAKLLPSLLSPALSVFLGHGWQFTGGGAESAYFSVDL